MQSLKYLISGKLQNEVWKISALHLEDVLTNKLCLMVIYITSDLDGHLNLGLRSHCQPFRPAPNGHWPTETGGPLELLQCNFLQREFYKTLTDYHQ